MLRDTRRLRPEPDEEEPDIMAYHGAIKLFPTLEAADWFDVRQLVKIISSIRKINFSVVEQRQQALELLNKLTPVDTPFSRNLRFPADRALVCEALGDWPRKFQQLKSALSYKDRASEVAVREQNAPRETVGRAQGLDDAQQAFWNATTAIYDELTTGTGVYTRQIFEIEFSLDWR